MSANKSYRIKANVGQDSVLNVNLNQNFNTFEILSLKINSENLYKFHTSDYGCVAGRVLANGNFGIPNAKISIFIKATDEDLSDAILSYLYPYKNTRTKNDDGIRYNLLPEDQLSDCHRNVGTFPSKRLVLDDNNVFEVYDKYYKYTTRSNESGDFMIFGVPVGEQTIHVDIDLSDIGILSQRPRDMIYKGYNVTQFENANMFKSSTDLEQLAQIISQNANVYVYPFWGEKTEGDIAITRKDIEIQYTFEPTCVFMGSMITDEKSNAISKTCVPSERMGKMDRLTTGNGTIEMIRKKPDGSVEEKIIQGNQLIDGNGVWCYQIPMNLDYVCTDEYGNIVPTDDPKKGIPTRTRVRFRMSITEFETGGEFSHAAKTLVPNNPQNEDDVDYVFGTDTKDDEFATKSFRDLFWNQVYSVKSYIPRFQQGNYNRNKRFSGIKVVNVNGGNNPMPYNNMRIDISFIFGLQCAIFHILLWIVGIYNNFVYHTWNALHDLGWPLRTISDWVNTHLKCLYIGDSFCPDLEGWYFAPKCRNGSDPYKNAFRDITNTDEEESDRVKDKKSIEYENPNEEQEKACLTNNIDYFVQCVEINLAMEHDVIQFDFYNDWINGTIYSPRWNADIRKKRSYLFGLIRVNPRLNACSEENFGNTRRLVQQCAMTYGFNPSTNAYDLNTTPVGCANNNRQRCHKAKGRKFVRVFGSKNGGVVHREITSSEQNIYYYKPCEWNSGKRHLFFATDIILLGSLNENDGQGIPQMFKKLSSSTYQLPDALASTNIGTEGFLYGAGGQNGGHLCNGYSNGVVVNKVEGNFDNLVKWSNGSEDYEQNPYDDKKPITESSGIDWGFSGPEQGSNKLSSLYFPGGHFLGISCMNSESNVKSCVNLSRVCELGSTISHRQSFVVKKDNNSYDFVYIIPSGLISGDELLDATGRNEFASLNYNKLKTRYNQENGLLEYEFKTIFPINYNGELKNKIGSEYQKREGDKYIRTIEENNKDYYRFRMGTNGEEDESTLKKKYLYVGGGGVSMPVYENSFYFYFGINNGNTALDRFNKDFFAECPALKPHEPEIKISYTEGDICNVENGKIKATISVYTANVEDSMCSISNSDYSGIVLEPRVTKTFDVYTNTKYTVSVWGSNIVSISKDIEIPVAIPRSVLDIQYMVNDFTEGVKYTADNFSGCNTDITGSISFENIDSNIAAILITDRNYYHYVYNPDSITGKPDGVNATEINYGDIPGDENECYLWRGNVYFDIYVKVRCDENLSQWIKYENFISNMPAPPDVIFGGNYDASYMEVVKDWQNIDTNRYNIEKIIDDTDIDAKIRASIKKALSFRNSKYDMFNTGEIDVTIINPSNSNGVTIQGNEDTTNLVNGVYRLSYDPPLTTISPSTLTEIFLPTKFMPTKSSYPLYITRGYNGKDTVGSYFWVTTPIYKSYDIDSGKQPYRLQRGGIVNFSADLYYLPFYFKALIIRNSGSTATASVAIANAIKGGSESYSVKVNGINVGNKVDEDLSIEEMKRRYDGGIGTSFSIEDMYPIDTADANIRYEQNTDACIVSVTDTVGRTIEETVESHFIGDRGRTGLLPFVSESENKIRYYLVKKALFDKLDFKSRYKFARAGVGENSIYPDGKALISDKLKMTTWESNGNGYIYRSKFFPTWDIGRYEYVGGDLSHVEENETNAFKAWPVGTDGSIWQYILLIDSGITPSGYLDTMWSSWTVLSERFGSHSNDGSGIDLCNFLETHWMTEDTGANNLRGTINVPPEDWYVIGVYDKNYHYQAGQQPTDVLNGDGHSSSVIMVRIYTIGEFNALRRELGLIQ